MQSKNKKKHTPSKSRRMKHHMRQIVFEAELKLASMSIYSSGEVYGPKAGKVRKQTAGILKTLRKCHANEMKAAQRRKEKLEIPGIEYHHEVAVEFFDWFSKIVISHNRKC